MSFLPKFNITRIPRANTAFFIQDASGTYPGVATGFGVPNGPANLLAITSLFGAVQAYAENPVNSTATAGDLSEEAEIDVAIQDGVNTFIAYYGETKAVNWTIPGDRKTLQVSDGGLTDLLEAVYSIGNGSDFPIIILSKSDTLINLASEWPGTETSGTSFVRYWKATVVELTMNQGYGKIVNETAKMSYWANKQDKVIELLEDNALFDSAKNEFNNGNYALAHEKARLLIYSKPAVTNTCRTC